MTSKSASSSAEAASIPPILDSLIGLRGLAAIAVYLFHYATFRMAFAPGSHKLVLEPLARPLWLTMAGNFAVSSFFILSGFVLTLATSPRMSMANYAAKRFGKLYPVYGVTTVLVVSMLLVLHRPVEVSKLLVTLLLVQSWVPHQDFYHAMNPVTWSLSTEAFFYVLFPFSYFFLRRISDRVIYVVVSCILVLEFAVPAYVQTFFDVRHASGNNYIATGSLSDLAYWLVLPCPPFRFLEFLFGMCACVLWKRGSLPAVRLRYAWILLSIAYVVGTFTPQPFQRTAIGVGPLSLLVVALADADSRGRRTILSSGPMVLLGKLSYALYALQLMVFLPARPWLEMWADHVLPASARSVGHILIQAALYAFLILLALPLYRWVEVPAYEMCRRLGRRSKPSELFGDVATIENGGRS